MRTKAFLIYGLLIAIAILTFSPFVLSVLGSLKDARSILAWPPQIFRPPFHPENYVRVWRASPLFPVWVRNSVVLALIMVVVKLLSCSMAGYAFARLRFPGRNVFFWATLSTMMVPYSVTLVPNYTIMAKLGWVDTYLPLIIPGISDAFGVFLMTQFFKTLPRDYEDAARVDGASWFTIFWRVMLPLARPADASSTRRKQVSRRALFCTGWAIRQGPTYIPSQSLRQVRPGGKSENTVPWARAHRRRLRTATLGRWRPKLHLAGDKITLIRFPKETCCR